MKNIEVSIKVEFNEVKDGQLTDKPEKIEDGHFRFTLDSKMNTDIDGLENALLQTNYPALRDGLASYLENVSQKKR